MDIKPNLSCHAALCLMLSKTHYAQNYAGIISLGLIEILPYVCMADPYNIIIIMSLLTEWISLTFYCVCLACEQRSNGLIL